VSIVSVLFLASLCTTIQLSSVLFLASLCKTIMLSNVCCFRLRSAKPLYLPLQIVALLKTIHFLTCTEEPEGIENSDRDRQPAGHDVASCFVRVCVSVYSPL